MIRNITFGQFYPGDSVIHKLDPRVKIAWTFFFIFLVFFSDETLLFLLEGVFLYGIIRISKIPVSYIFRGMKPIAFLILFTALINLFMIQGATPLFTFYSIKIYPEGVVSALTMIARMILLVAGTCMLTYTTSPIRLTDGIEAILRPLSAIRFPAHEIAMMMTIALRFIPTLLEETDKIMKAQTARGADFKTGNLFRRAKALLPILIPLFVSAFRRADDLASAMESRCYHGGEGRSRMKEMKISARDGWAITISLLFLLIIVLVSIFK